MRDKNIWLYILKFAIIFCIFYFGTLAVIGLSSPAGSYYSSFIDHHLDYVSWLRASLMNATKGLLHLMRYDTYIISPSFLKLQYEGGINVAYDCLGYGIISFWIAFVIANKGKWQKKISWIFCGTFFLWCINVLRLSLILIFIKRKWNIPFFDQHTWFNIAAYFFIFLMIYFYDRSSLTTKSGIPKYS